MRMRFFRDAMLTAVLSACGSSTEPLASTTIVGEFGGDQALLHATTSKVTLDVSCGAITLDPPLVTDATGRFSSAGSRRRVGGVAPLPGEASTPIHIAGRAFTTNGGTLQDIVSPIPEEPGAPV